MKNKTLIVRLKREAKDYPKDWVGHVSKISGIKVVANEDNQLRLSATKKGEINLRSYCSDFCNIEEKIMHYVS